MVNKIILADIKEPTIIFRINKLYNDRCSATELYDITRGRWKLGERREQAQLAFAVVDNIILEVYEIHQWHEGGTTPNSRKDPAPPGRWEFVGQLAEDEIREKYKDQSVAQYFGAGARNPVRYVNI